MTTVCVTVIAINGNVLVKLYYCVHCGFYASETVQVFFIFELPVYGQFLLDETYFVAVSCNILWEVWPHLSILDLSHLNLSVFTECPEALNTDHNASQIPIIVEQAYQVCILVDWFVNLVLDLCICILLYRKKCDSLRPVL